MLDRLVHRDNHFSGFGQPDQVPTTALYRNFSNITVLFDGQDDFAFEVVAQDFGEFAEAGFHLVTDGGSYFKLPSKVLYVH